MISYSELRADCGFGSALIFQGLGIEPVRLGIALIRYLQVNMAANALRETRHGLSPFSVWKFVRQIRIVLHDNTLEIFPPLSVLEAFNRRARILILGAQSETELLHLLAYGVSLSQVTAISPTSTSPWIEEGDLSRIQAPDQNFDIVVILGQSLFQSQWPEILNEAERLVRPSGLIAVQALIDKAEVLKDENPEAPFIRIHADRLKKLFKGELLFKNEPQQPKPRAQLIYIVEASSAARLEH